MKRLALCGMLLAALIGVSALAEESPDPLSAEARQKQAAEFDAELEKADAAVKASPRSVGAYSSRGDVHLFLGRFAEAVADYDRMVTLDPNLETSHWRRGIAYFYAKAYDKAAHQFEIYHTFDDVDRENGIWRFLSQTKARGLKFARMGLLKYKKDDREPFPDVYRMFAGEIEPDAVLERIRQADLSDNARQQRLFYAELYVGLYLSVLEKNEDARPHLAAAVRNTWGQAAGGGPGYMWQVGRVHYLQLDQPAAKPAP